MAIRITQSGVALTVGIIVLTGIIIGGFFIVKNSGEQARREDAIKVAEQNLEDQSNNGVALNEDPDKTTNEPTPSSEGAVTGDDATNESTDLSNSTGTTASNQVTNELPQTGPADQLASLMAIVVLTFSVSSYVTSRRRASNLDFSPYLR